MKFTVNLLTTIELYFKIMYNKIDETICNQILIDYEVFLFLLVIK